MGNTMHWLWTIIIGLIIGIVAKLITPGKDPGGCIITSLLGIAGGMFATFIGRQIGWYQVGDAAGFIAAVIGAVVLLLLYRMIRGRM